MAERGWQGSRRSRVAWLIVLAISALVLAYGGILFFSGPDMVLENVSERTSLAPDDYRVGSPSASDVMSVVVRQTASFTVAVGFMALIAGWRGYRYGSEWAWWAMLGVPVAIAGTGIGFVLAAGVSAQAMMFLGLAVVFTVALLAIRPDPAA